MVLISLIGVVGKMKEKTFRDLVGELTDDEFWSYIRSWFSEDFILDTMNNWDSKIQEEERIKLKRIIKKRK